MREIHYQIIAVLITALGLTLIAFLYSTEPRTFAEVASKGEVVLGTYSVNKTEFDSGLAAFRRDEFPAARAAFERADPEHRDASTQFYVAYSYYRQGWGKLSNDDALFTSGIQAVDRVIAIDPKFRSSDDNLAMKTPQELKAELDEGTKLTLSDLDPRRLLRERK